MSVPQGLPVPFHDRSEKLPMLNGSSNFSDNDPNTGGTVVELTSKPNTHAARSDTLSSKERKVLLCFLLTTLLILVASVSWILWQLFSQDDRNLHIMNRLSTSQLLTTESSTMPSSITELSTEDLLQTLASSSTSSTTTILHQNTDIQSTTTLAKKYLAKKVLFIIADGIPADVLENLPVVNMRRIQTLGAYTRAFVGGIKGTYSQTATISSPGYMSLLTGTWGNKHNVYDNYVRKPNYYYKNIFRLVKEQDSTKTIAIFSTWTTNRIKLVGEGLQEAGNITFDYTFDGYELDHVNYPHDKGSGYIRRIDQRVTNETVQCIKENAPDLSWVYLQYTDDIGHYFGDSDAFNQSILLLDNQIGQIWDAINDRIQHHQEDWLVIITTDHGRDPKTGKHHAGQSSRERTTWLITNSPETNSYFHQFEPAIVDVLPTILRFFNLTVPIAVQRELDGVPLVGRVSLINPNMSLQNNSLMINWTAIETTGTVKIWLSTTNLFKRGIMDNYTLMAIVPIDRTNVLIDVENHPSRFYKIILEGPSNMVNRWIHRP